MCATTKNPTGKRIEARLVFQDDTQLYRLDFPAMGTNCKVLYQASSRQIAADFARAATQWVANFESTYSRFRDNSLISAINRNAGIAPIQIDSDMKQLLDLCDSLHFQTQGLLDVTALPIYELWNSRGNEHRSPTESEIAATLQIVGWDKVQRTATTVFLPHKGMKLDFGGFGKEYAVDQAATLAEHFHIQSYLIDFGRDIRVGAAPNGQDRWNIGIQDPNTQDKILGSLYIAQKSVATSGNYIRNFNRGGAKYGHILDPRIGRPLAASALAATVLSDTCLEAGTLSTCACILGTDEGLRRVEESILCEGLITNETHFSTTKGFHEYAQLN